MATSLEGRIWAVCFIFPEMISLVITVYRLHYRWKTRMLWWDDYLAFVALLAGLPFYWTTWVLVVGDEHSPSFQVATAWIGIIAFLVALWTTKISLALSIARVMYKFPRNTAFRGLLVLASTLTILGIASAATRCAMCATYDSWRNSSPYMCPATPAGSILPYTASMVCDIALFLTPLRLFWSVQLPPLAKRLVLAGFAGTCLMLPIDIVNTAYGFMAIGGTTKGSTLRAVFMHLAAVVSFLACNAVVVLACIYRRINREDTEFISELTELSKVPTTRIVAPHLTPSDWTSSGLSGPQLGSKALTEVSMRDSDFGTGETTRMSSVGTPSNASKSTIQKEYP